MNYDVDFLATVALTAPYLAIDWITEPVNSSREIPENKRINILYTSYLNKTLAPLVVSQRRKGLLRGRLFLSKGILH